MQPTSKDECKEVHSSNPMPVNCSQYSRYSSGWAKAFIVCSLFQLEYGFRMRAGARDSAEAEAGSAGKEVLEQAVFQYLLGGWSLLRVHRH